MRFSWLRGYLGLHGNEVASSRNVFKCGIGWFPSFYGRIAIARGKRGDEGVFAVTVKDNITEWRNKLDTHTSNAEYDLIFKRSEQDKVH